MKKPALLSLCLGCILVPFAGEAIDLKQSKITQVVNDVAVISAANQTPKAAAVNDIFAMPDILKTGPASRAELVAPDQTITRVGANTIFSFDPANRTIDLQQGSLLFHAPHGKGGGSIHTGSATASVLGTTVIVSATPNGGFKVIVLEGQAEINFLNGLKQKLDAGQMTFVLPGANQLAPVVIFRLDELIENSLLVKGFSQPLASLPLIENQIALQLKLLHSGKLSDTGLYAGDSATVNQVEVLDINTIQHGQNSQQSSGQQSSGQPPLPVNPPPANLAAAEAADATINQSSLLSPLIPTPPVHVITGSTFPLTGNAYFNGQEFGGFVARNIYINTATPNPLVVNLGPYSSLSAFDLVAVNNFLIEGSVLFSGLSDTANFDLIAGKQFTLTPGVTIEADVHDFLISSPATLSFDNVALKNGANNLTLNSAGDISFENGSSVAANAAFFANAGGNIVSSGSQFITDKATLTSLNGSITLDNSTLTAGSHSIFIAPVSIELDGSLINSAFVTLSGTATASITLNNTVINGSSSIVAVCINDINITGGAVADAVKTGSPHTVPGGSALNADPASGTVTLASAGGSVNVSGTDISAHYLTLNSGDGILLDASGHTITATGPGAQSQFTAPNLVTVRYADLTSFAVVNMAANTIVLANDALSLISNFGTKTGLANFSGGVVPGELNLFNCTWQNTPVTSELVTYSSGPGNTPGIYSYAR